MSTNPHVDRRLRRDAAANRASIVAAATATIAHDPHASLDTIARTAGLSRRALYGHFDDRDALIREVIAVGAERFNAVADAIDDGDPRVALARLTVRLWREAAHVQLAAAVALDEAHVGDTATALAPLRGTVMRLVRRGQRGGVLRADVPAATLARLVEETARTVVTRMDAAAPDALSIAVRGVLSIAGLSWRETGALLDAHPELMGDE